MLLSNKPAVATCRQRKFQQLPKPQPLLNLVTVTWFSNHQFTFLEEVCTHSCPVVFFLHEQLVFFFSQFYRWWGCMWIQCGYNIFWLNHQLLYAQFLLNVSSPFGKCYFVHQFFSLLFLEGVCHVVFLHKHILCS